MLAPSVPTEAPTRELSLASGPTVTVLEHADIANSNVPTASVVSVFFIYVKNHPLRRQSFDNL